MTVALGPIFVVLALSHSPEEVKSASDRVLGENYQTVLPDRSSPGAEDPGGSAGKVQRRRDRGAGPLGSITSVLLWVLLFATAAVAIVWVAGHLYDRSGDGEAPGAAARPPPDPDLTERPLGDADTLAQLGQYDEAIHVLLLRTLDELRRRSGGNIAPSLTSREIVRQVAIPEAARRELAGLVTAVELSRFGGDVADEGDYRLCLQRFRRFAEAYVGAAA